MSFHGTSNYLWLFAYCLMIHRDQTEDNRLYILLQPTTVTRLPVISDHQSILQEVYIGLLVFM